MIFDELLKLGKIKISHTLPPPDEIKKHAYCKFHHSYSHATNDCNSFRRQIQSAINEGHSVLHKMQVDQNPFPVIAFMNTLELLNPKVLIGSDQADKAKGKNIIIGEQRPDEKLSLEETPKIAAKASTLRARHCRKSRRCINRSGYCLWRFNRVQGRSNRVQGRSNHVPRRSARYLLKKWRCSQEKGKAEF
jgi:hypothetical protein